MLYLFLAGLSEQKFFMQELLFKFYSRISYGGCEGIYSMYLDSYVMRYGAS